MIRASSPFAVSATELAAAFSEAGKFVAQEFTQASDRPIMPRVPQSVFEEVVGKGLPQEGLPLEAVRKQAQAFLTKYSARIVPAGFSAMVTTSPNPYALLGDMLACAVNQHVMRGDVCEFGARLEERVIRWIGAFMEYPSASGILTLGGASANLIALAAARTQALGKEVRQRGLRSVHLVAYASTETHSSTMRALDILGIGTDNLKRVPVDERYRLKVDLLKAAIRADRAEGRRPFAVIAQGGSTATGAVDPLEDLAQLCEREQLWLHVDAAYGGPAAAIEPARELFAGLHRADSVTVDPAKWLYVNYDCGCLLTKHAHALNEAFSVEGASYLQADTPIDAPDFMSRGIDFSRAFRALKIWATFVGLGARTLKTAIAQDMRLAENLAALVSKSDRFVLCAPPSLSIVVFQFVPEPGLPAPYLDALNAKIPSALRADGRIYASAARIGVRTALRFCLLNHRVTDTDVVEWLRIVADAGAALHKDRATWWDQPGRL